MANLRWKPIAFIFVPALAVMAILLASWMTVVVRAEGDPPPTPERIAGLEVLGVRNSDNTTCYPSDSPLVMLKSSAPSHDNLLSSSVPDMDAINRGLRDAGFPEGTEVGIAGPGITAEMEASELAKWNALRKANGCIQLGGGSRDSGEDGSSSSVADFNPNLSPGYSNIVDSEIGPYTNHNAQSVILEAPTIGDSQSNFSAFLNNGLSNAAPGQLMQNGFLFDGEEGGVIWDRRGQRPISKILRHPVSGRPRLLLHHFLHQQPMVDMCLRPDSGIQHLPVQDVSLHRGNHAVGWR